MNASLIGNITNPHFDLLTIGYAFLIGFIGSMAYVTAVNFKFVGGNDDHRSVMLSPFRNKKDRLCPVRFVWYALVGGLIATIFQMPQSAFAPIQNFIIGCAWPAMVTQFLTGRMYDITEGEKEDLMNRASQISERQTSEIIDLNGIKSKLEEMEN